MVILFMLEKYFPPLARVVTVTFFVIPDKNGFSFIILVFVLFFFLCCAAFCPSPFFTSLAFINFFSFSAFSPLLLEGICS